MNAVQDGNVINSLKGECGVAVDTMQAGGVVVPDRKERPAGVQAELTPLIERALARKSSLMT